MPAGHGEAFRAGADPAFHDNIQYPVLTHLRSSRRKKESTRALPMVGIAVLFLVPDAAYAPATFASLPDMET